jgi:hypothetical protein
VGNFAEYPPFYIPRAETRSIKTGAWFYHFSDDEAGTEIEGEIDSAGSRDRRVFGEGNGAAVHMEDGFASQVVVRNDFGAEREAGTIGVFARAVDVVGAEGKRLRSAFQLRVKGRKVCQ